MRTLALTLILTTSFCFAQTPARPSQPAASQPVRRARPPAYPQHPQADKATIDRGKALYGVHCGFCHGSDARGGEGGPNLLRSQMVLNDQKGEVIATIVQNGREAMPKFALTKAQISDIAAFVHSFTVGGYDISRMTPPSIVVGDAHAGEAYFKSTCSGCHSITGDLKDLAGRFSDAKVLQQAWLMPGGGRRAPNAPPPGAGNVPPTTVTVTLPSGQQVSGSLARIDDFFVSLTDSDGSLRSFERNGDLPKVEVHDPLEPHKELLTKYTDKDIHDLTAYLVTLK